MDTPSAKTPPIGERLGINGPAGRNARLNRWLVRAIVVSAIALGVIIWTTGGGADEPEYVTQPVERGDLTVTVSATGSLAPTNQVDVGSELSGIVRTVEVDVDDRVKDGQVLARLDTTKLEAQAMQSRASLAATQAQLEQRQATLEEARKQLVRLEDVFQASNGRVPSLQELDAQRASVRRAEADVENGAASVSQARAALDAIQTDLSKMVIRSPIDGVVLTRSVDPGQTVAASFQAPVLFTIAEDLTKMELTVNVDEADIGQVQRKQQATFTVDAYPGRVFRAQVAEVRFASETVNGVVTYGTVLYVGNPDLLLRPGMTATAEIVVRRVTDALLVPNAALRFVPPNETAPSGSPGGGNIIGRLIPRPRPSTVPAPADAHAGRQIRQRVWILRDGVPAAVPITAGATNGVMTEVVRGDLQPGTAVIVDVAGQGR